MKLLFLLFFPLPLLAAECINCISATSAPGAPGAPGTENSSALLQTIAKAQEDRKPATSIYPISEEKQKLVKRISRSICGKARRGDFLAAKMTLKNMGKRYLGEEITIEEAYPYIQCGGPQGKGIDLLRVNTINPDSGQFFEGLILYFEEESSDRNLISIIASCKRDIYSRCLDIFEYIEYYKRTYSDSPSLIRKLNDRRDFLHKRLKHISNGPIRYPLFCQEVLNEPPHCLLKGESLLKQNIGHLVNVRKESEHDKSTLKLLSLARESKAQAQEFEALRNRYGSLRFRDCEGCPEMAIVPAGSYMMGSTDSESGRYRDEGPVHRVTMAQPFAVGVYEVTFAQWDTCRRDGVCSHAPSDEGWGRGSRPVMNVSWHDAKEYVRWLSRKTGKGYRLLSEAEWEYVARAGTRTRYWWGDEVGHGWTNCSDCGSRWDGDSTAPVGSFVANAFGMYDVHGNVEEWVEDCWHGGYAGAPSDGSAWTAGGNCEDRVLRGGSWFSGSRGLRSADRFRYAAGDRNDVIGFRVARILD